MWALKPGGILTWSMGVELFLLHRHVLGGQGLHWNTLGGQGLEDGQNLLGICKWLSGMCRVCKGPENSSSRWGDCCNGGQGMGKRCCSATYT